MNRQQALKLLDKYKLAKNFNEVASDNWFEWNNIFIQRLMIGEFDLGKDATSNEINAYEAAEEVLAIECVTHVF